MSKSRKLLLESLAIVVSILLAFAIDAWWDSIRDRARTDAQIDALRVDLGTNADRLERASERGRRSLSGAQALILAIGPATPSISEDSLQYLFGAAFSHGAEGLEMSSTLSLLDGSAIGDGRRPELVRTLSDFRAGYEQYSRDGELFIELREDLIAYLITVAPGAFFSAGTGRHAPTDFPVPIEELLRDQRLEGLAGNMTVRIGNLNGRAERLAAVVDSLSTLIDPGQGRN